MKACKVSCIGCGKCEKECPFGAITVENNCSYIDWNKCRLCKKCVAVCPTKAIQAVNFPAPKAIVTDAANGSDGKNGNNVKDEGKEEKA
jgi:ferredoxin